MSVRPSHLELGLGALGTERVDDGVVQVLDLTDLFLADTRLRLDNAPKPEDTDVNFFDVYRGIDHGTAGNLLDIRLKLSDTFTDDLGHDNVTLLIDLDVWCSWECRCIAR